MTIMRFPRKNITKLSKKLFFLGRKHSKLHTPYIWSSYHLQPSVISPQGPVPQQNPSEPSATLPQPSAGAIISTTGTLPPLPSTSKEPTTTATPSKVTTEVTETTGVDVQFPYILCFSQ